MGDFLELLAPVFDAFKGGDYALGTVLGIVALVALATRYVKPHVKFLQGDAGTSLLVLLGSGAIAMLSPLAGGAAMSFGLLWMGVKTGALAAGGFKMAKELIAKPLLKLLKRFAPKWSKPLIMLLEWVFGTKATVKAEKAGTEAVAAKPSTGAAGVVGSPNDLP